MSDKKTGGYAFPLAAQSWADIKGNGMTLRDYFAGQAMQGLLASATRSVNPEELARDSFYAADAMLKAREA